MVVPNELLMMAKRMVVRVVSMQFGLVQFTFFSLSDSFGTFSILSFNFVILHFFLWLLTEFGLFDNYGSQFRLLLFLLIFSLGVYLFDSFSVSFDFLGLTNMQLYFMNIMGIILVRLSPVESWVLVLRL